jgi:hypothetical protein
MEGLIPPLLQTMMLLSNIQSSRSQSPYIYFNHTLPQKYLKLHTINPIKPLLSIIIPKQPLPPSPLPPPMNLD